MRTYQQHTCVDTGLTTVAETSTNLFSPPLAVRKTGFEGGGGYYCEAISDGAPPDKGPDGDDGGLLLLGVVLIVVLVGVRTRLSSGVLLLRHRLLRSAAQAGRIGPLLPIHHLF